MLMETFQKVRNDHTGQGRSYQRSHHRRTRLSGVKERKKQNKLRIKRTRRDGGLAKTHPFRNMEGRGSKRKKEKKGFRFPVRVR